MFGCQLSFELDWGREPWQGFRPRSLVRRAWPNVDKSDTLPKPAREAENFTRPAQLIIWISSSPFKEVDRGS